MTVDKIEERGLGEEDSTASIIEDGENRFDGMTKTHIWAYGVGHFINDLAAACWFNYLFFFLKKVVKTEAAAAALLTGQICDGIATPTVGILSDKFSFRIGQRRPWYIGGLLVVIACFIPLFSGFTSNKTGQYIFYTIFPGLFNMGWASLQISHMSLVPALTCSRKRRDKLNNLRNLFTFISNFAVLGFGLILFLVMSNRGLEYQLISYFAVGMGLIASVFFLVKIDEPRLTQECATKAENLKNLIDEAKIRESEIATSILSESQGMTQTVRRESIFNWFRLPQFYLFGVCYMSVRLYVNLFGTLMPFYIIDVLKMDSGDEDKMSYNISLIPMIAYFSSSIVSTRLNWFYEKFGRKKALFLGTILCVICLVIMIFLTPSTSWILYILASFIGCSQSLVLSTGINFISDVVGTKAKTGAFVFGAYSLLDKFASGIAIFTIGNTEAYSKPSNKITQSDSDFIRYTMISITGVACVLSSLIVLTYPIDEYKQNKDINQRLINRKKSKLQEELVA